MVRWVWLKNKEPGQTEVLVFIYQGAVLVHVFEPVPASASFAYPKASPESAPFFPFLLFWNWSLCVSLTRQRRYVFLLGCDFSSLAFSQARFLFLLGCDFPSPESSPPPQAAVLATRFQRWAQEHGHPRRSSYAK